MIDIQIINEIYKVVENLGGQSDILSVIGSYRETLSDEDVLLYLKEWNATHDNKSHSSESRLDYTLV